MASAISTNSPSNIATSTTATAAASHHSPRHSATDNKIKSRAVGSPRSRRATRAVSSPWTKIVRGESETIAAAPSSPSAAANEQAAVSACCCSSSSMAEEEGSETGNGLGGNAAKRPAWNKPSNGAMEIGPVMGAASWPALSESARASTKSSSDSLKGLSDGSLSSSVPQGTGAATSSSEKQVGNSSNPSSTSNHTLPARQRSMKRNVFNTSSNSGAPQSPRSQAPVGEFHLNNSSPRDNSERNPQPRAAIDHPQQQRNSFRNRNGGPHSRADGSHHHNHGGRRDQDPANQDWNNHRHFNGRDSHMHPQRVVPRFMRQRPPPPPPSSMPFITPSPVRPFGSPMGFPELPPPVYYVPAPPPDSFRGLPFVAAPVPPHAMLFPTPDFQLHSKIVTQIDYYFSTENLIKDTFLRQNMDDQGWVPVQLIAGFNKVSHLTNNIQLILDAMRSSTIVEVQGDKLRRRNDWMEWRMPPSVWFPNVSSARLPEKSSDDILASHIQNLSLEESVSNHINVKSSADVPTEALLSSSSSRDLNSQLDLSGGLGMDQVSAQERV